MAKHRLGEVLVAARLISEAQLHQALEVQGATGGSLLTILVGQGAITEDLALRSLAGHLGVSAWRIEKNLPQPDALDKIPFETCLRYQFLPVRLQGDLLTLAMRNPMDVEAIDLARNLSKCRIEPALANEERLARAIEASQHRDSRVRSTDRLVDEALRTFDVTADTREDTVISEEDTRPVVELVNQILTDAIRLQASDVHIEPRGDRLEVRLRVDGHLQKIREMPPQVARLVATRIKIMAELDIVEYRLPQDGRITVQVDGREVDLRVSIIPNSGGQRIVIRILDRTASLRPLDQLGFSSRHLELFRQMIDRPHGIVLVTGPTGSGKTTTLYAALAELQKGTNNIMTCEDPVEYDIDGISQSQVFEKIGLTFAELLRSMLRQDPDVILVGEIRDQETAETAIRAALTGHLVLSTLHCNDAPSAIPRLLDMGIDPYLLSTCLVGVTAQRLVRTLCPHCREVDPESPETALLARILGVERPPQLWRAKGCPRCFQSGYRGRQAVHELLPVTSEVASAVASRLPMQEVRRIASLQGYEPMQVDAMRRVLEGSTTLSEARDHVYFHVGSDEPGLRAA